MKLLAVLVAAVVIGLALFFFLGSNTSRRGIDSELALPSQLSRSAEPSARETEELSLVTEAPSVNTTSTERFSMPSVGVKTVRKVRRRLRGVLLAAGRPLKEGRVEVRIGDRVIAQARTSEFGRFDVQFIQQREEAQLVTVARGFVPLRRPLGFRKTSAPENIGNLRLMRGLLLRGTVISMRGDSVPGADVQIGLGIRSTQTVDLKTVTDENGEFEFREAPNGQITITASALGYGARRIDHSHGSTRPVVVQLRPAHTLRLRLHNGRGFPVADAEVELNCSDPGSPKRRQVSDREGRVVFADLGAPIWSVRVMKANHRPSSRTRMTADGREHQLEVPLWPGITGRVTAPPDHKLPADTQVFALPYKGPSDRTLTGGGQPIEKNGRFRIGDLRPGYYVLHVRASGFAPYSSEAVTIALNEDSDVGQVQLVVGGRLEVLTVVGTQPLAEVTCDVRRVEPRTAEMWRPLLRRVEPLPKTDARGRATIDGLGEKVWLMLRKEGYLPQVHGPLRTQGSEAELLRLPMERGATLTGTVKNSHGLPQAGVRIRVTEEGTRIGMPIQLNSQPDGIYRTIALPPGSYKVQTISNPTDMSEAQTVLLESGKEFRLDLKVAKAQ